MMVTFFLRIVRAGVKNLLLHKARSFLTMLGIIFGVASVIAMLAVGEGASMEQQEAIRRLGSSNIIIETVKPINEDQTTSSQSSATQLNYGITYRDAFRMQEALPYVKHMVPIRKILLDVQAGHKKLQSTIIATIPLFKQVRRLRIMEGRFLSQLDELHIANHCVISENLARQLFGFYSPLGKTIRVQSFYFKVVGVFASNLNPAQKTAMKEWDLRVFIPLSTSRKLIGDFIVKRETGSFQAERVELHEVILQVDDITHVEATALALQQLLKHFHKGKKDYSITVPLRLLEEAQRTKRIFSIVLASIAAISLLVGGIGIMNIMLATITERTQEIGIRRALGAKKIDIVLQFLIETLILTISGGAFGIILGIIIPHQISIMSGITTIIRIWALSIAFGVSVLIGLIFGLYPAWRAAQLDPIEALRHE